MRVRDPSFWAQAVPAIEARLDERRDLLKTERSAERLAILRRIIADDEIRLATAQDFVTASPPADDVLRAA